MSPGRFADLLSELPFQAVSLLDENAVVRVTSDKDGQLAGGQPGQTHPSKAFAEVHPDHLAEAQRLWVQVMSSPGVAVSSCLRMKHRDGSWKWIAAASRNLLEDPQVKSVVVHWRVATTQSETGQTPGAFQARDEQVLQAQKMDAIGRLAGQVAHDFNNLLSIIGSAGALIHDELAADHPSQPMTEEIRLACRRAVDLTRQLLSFSRRQLLVPGPVSVNEIVKAALDEVRGQLGPSIRVITQLDPQVGAIHADAQQLERVVVQLALNARDAMPQGGQLTFSTSNLSASNLEPEGKWVSLGVEDSGVGMNARTRMHLFEPFFTTKPRGKGVGLGLATAWGIVCQSNGRIRVRSEEGQGASFELVFPRMEDHPAHESALTSPTPLTPTIPR